MNCTKCKNRIPDQRLKILPNTKVCTECSDVEAVAAVDIVYHKTGNTIQIMDKESADSINKAARRSGFGSLRSMKGGSGGSESKVKLGSSGFVPRKPTQEDFEKVGEEMMSLIDWESRDLIIKYLDLKLENRTISAVHYRKLRTILNQFKPEEVVTTIKRKEIEISEDIQWAFSNWKNTKTKSF